MIKYLLHGENPQTYYAFFACVYFLLSQNIINGLSDLLCFDVKENGSLRYVHWEFPSLCGSNKDLRICHRHPFFKLSLEVVRF